MTRLAKLVFWLAVLFPTIGYCGNAAIATGSGNVMLNGRWLMRSSAVFSGDELKTETDSAVVLHSKGSTIQVGPRALIVLGEDALIVETGTARVSGTSKVLAGNVTISPYAHGANFVVMRSGGVITVKVLKESIRIQRRAEEIVLSQGENRSFQENDSSNLAARGRNKREAMATGTTLGAGIGAVIASHLNDHTQSDMSTGSWDHFGKPNAIR